MLVLIVYDIATSDRAGAKRLRLIARACEDYGQRVQKSVFECRLGPSQWALLKPRLLETMDPASDSVRFYYLDSDVVVEHFGANPPVDMDSPLLV